MADPRRAIPSTDRLLASDAFAELLDHEPRALVIAALQRVQDELRTTLAAGAVAREQVTDPSWFAAQTREALATLRRPSLRPVINATGVVLHTNLGRAPLAPAALRAIEVAARGYANLEYDIQAGARGSRYVHCVTLLRQLTGAEGALVVNNNAAALVLALNTLAVGRNVVVSRGELVEIGGSFRVPDIMARSGASMREVGSTNRTHLRDYVEAMDGETGAVLKVHPSNFRIEGFTAETTLGELAAAAHAHGIPLLHDLGSGLLIDSTTLGLPFEPTPADALQSGADIVAISGDKLLGGPQAGILLGNATLIERMRRNPLCRALRVDKLTLAALEATLALYLDPQCAMREIPALRMLIAPLDALQSRAASIAAACATRGVPATVVDGQSAVGGGAFPTAQLPTRLVRLEAALPAHVLEQRLRMADIPVVARIVDDAVCVDPRTVQPEEEPVLIDAIAAAAR